MNTSAEFRKTCADLVNEKFAETEAFIKHARHYFDEGQHLDEESQLELPYYVEDYENYYSFEEWAFNCLLMSPECIDFCESEDGDEEADFWRLQLSWGGPSDEFRIYLNGRPQDLINGATVEIAYHYMDWFDGASCIVPVNSESYDACIELLLEDGRAMFGPKGRR